METLRIFKISENQKKFDTVELLFDELNNLYIVRWKWSTMRNSMEKDFYVYDDAYRKYKERKKFAISCN